MDKKSKERLIRKSIEDMRREVIMRSIAMTVDMQRLTEEMEKLQGRDYVQAATGLLRVIATLAGKDDKSEGGAPLSVRERYLQELAMIEKSNIPDE